MAQEYPQVPPAAQRAVQQEFDRLAAAGAFSTPNLRRADRATLTLVDPHRSTDLTLTALLTQAHPTAHLRGWRFLVEDGRREPLAAAEGVAIGCNEYRLGLVNEGRFVPTTVEALRRARSIAPEAEPLLLVIPGLLVAALWLKRDAGEGLAIGDMDEILLLAPLPGGPDPFVPIPAPKFLDFMRELARKVPRDDLKGG